jgi:hypothetical protein
MPRTCFVIGPIGEAGTSTRVNADDFMKYIVADCPALGEFEYDTPIRADSLNEPGRITSQIIQLLTEADLVIADLTENNANVYYELSLRHAIGKPVIHMALDGTPLSFDVRDNRTIFYTMHARRVEHANDELSNQIRRVHKDGYKPMNPILETVAIINLERSADPVQNVVGQLMSKLDGMNGDIQFLRTAVRDLQVTNSWHDAELSGYTRPPLIDSRNLLDALRRAGWHSVERTGMPASGPLTLRSDETKGKG